MCRLSTLSDRRTTPYTTNVIKAYSKFFSCGRADGNFQRTNEKVIFLRLFFVFSFIWWSGILMVGNTDISVVGNETCGFFTTDDGTARPKDSDRQWEVGGKTSLVVQPSK